MNVTFSRIPAIRLAAGLLLALTSLASCKDDITLKNLDVPLSQDLVLNVPDTMPTSGLWAMELDPDGNSDVRDNRNKIQEITILKAGYAVIDYTGDPTATGSGNWKFYPSDNPADATLLNAASGYNFNDYKTSGTEQALTLSEATKGKLIQLIKDKKKITFAFEGSVSSKPVYVRFNVRLYTKLKIGL